MSCPLSTQGGTLAIPTQWSRWRRPMFVGAHSLLVAKRRTHAECRHCSLSNPPKYLSRTILPLSVIAAWTEPGSP